MAKKSLVAKAKRTPKFAGARLHQVLPVRAAACRLPQVRPLPDLLPDAWHTGASCPASPSPAGSRASGGQPHQPTRPGRDQRPLTTPKVPQGNHGEEGHQAMTMTDPVADMLTRLRNANSAYHDT